MKNKLFSLFAVIVMACLGFWLGIKVTMPPPRVIETTRMEECLNLYRGYRSDPDQSKLAISLASLSLTPKDFQEIIDRFIYYRSRKSSMNQAMQLLEAFRMGLDIKVSEVHSISAFASEPFRLDAEILAVFEVRPDLIEKAFEG